MIRVVVDPGVFVSALIGVRGAAPDLVVRALADDRIEVVASPLLLDELERVLRRPKFHRCVDEQSAREFVERVRRHVTLELGEGADAIVSGDRDLIDAGLLTPAVWTPRHLLDRMRAGWARGTGSFRRARRAGR